MKINPKKAALIGLAATTLFSLAGCQNRADNNNETQNETVEQETIDPSENMEPDVYGPPSE